MSQFKLNLTSTAQTVHQILMKLTTDQEIGAVKDSLD